MAGPPTPPPTTATELLDEEKDRAPSVAPAPPVQSPQEAPQPQQDPYQLVFPTIADLASKGDLHELIHVAEHTEIVVGVLDASFAIVTWTTLQSENNQQQTRLLVTAPLILAYLILDDLCVNILFHFTCLNCFQTPCAIRLDPTATRFTGASSTSSPSDASCVQLGKKSPKSLLSCTGPIQYAGRTRFLSRKTGLRYLTHAGGFLRLVRCPCALQVLNQRADSFRHRTFVLVSKAYVSIPLSLMQMYLGLPSDELLPSE